MASTYHHLYNIPLIGLRFFTVYGPWGRPDMAYYSFTKAILEEKPIDVYFEGRMFRDFTYIDDIVDGILSAMKIKEGNHLFNLGHHKPVQLSTFIETLEKLLHKKAKKNFLPLQPGDVLTTHADIKESELTLHFHPKVSLLEGLDRFVKWYRHYYNV